MKARRRLGQVMAEGMKEAIAFERGERRPGVRVRRVPVTARDAVVRSPRTYTALQLVRVRTRFKLSQRIFAEALNVSPETVRAWEQGKRTPDGAALRLLEFTVKQPALLLAVVQSRE